MSRIMYVKCDRCGKEFVPDAQHKVGWIGMTWRILETDDLESGVTPYEHCDFCESCMKAISDFIEGTVIEEEAPPEVEIVIPKHDEPVEEEPVTKEVGEAHQKGEEPPEPKKPKKNPPKQKKLDVDKIISLYTAKEPLTPWTPEKIAAEMHCTVQAVRYHLKKEGLIGGDADDRNGEGQA